MRKITYLKKAGDLSMNPEKGTVTISEKEYKKLVEIAKAASYSVFERGDLETRCNDGDDFLDVSVWSIEEMLVRAYEAGKNAR